MIMPETDFDAIRPYHQHEIPAALTRIASDPLFKRLINYLFPVEYHKELTEKLLQSNNTDDFQLSFMFPVIRSIVDKTADALTISGIESISNNKASVLLANHRDIVLDSSLLNLLMVERGFKTTEITWGDNLIISPFIEDVGKSNRMITVFRDGTPKEMLKNSQRLSEYIRQSITQRNQSVWIAQRKGRSKDGYDSTDVGVLKMLSLSGNRNVRSAMYELNIIPLAISYEWEPCDAMKVRELYVSEDHEYVKEEQEDIRSIVGGIASQKGRIHLSIGVPLNNYYEEIDPELRKNETLQVMANLTDSQIHKNYKLWPSNYYAYDLLSNKKQYADKYDQTTIDIFQERLSFTQDLIKGNHERVKQLYLNLYANPVINQIK